MYHYKSTFRLVTLVALVAAAGCGQGPSTAGNDAPIVDRGATATSIAGTCPVTKVIARGAPIHGSNGLAFDADGHLLIASYVGNEIVEMDRDTGEILARMSLPADAPPGVDDLAVANGSIYYTSLATGYVSRLSLDGKTLLASQFVAPGTNAIAFSADGRLFVGLDFFGDGLYELDPDLIEAPREIVPNQPGQYPLGFPNAFAFGPDGRLYAPLVVGGMVISIDVDSCSGSLSPWTDCDIRPVANVEYPMAVKFDASGSLDVVNHAGGVFRITHPTTATPGSPQLIAKLATGLDNLVSGAGDRLWISNTSDGSIARIADGRIDYISRAGMILPGGIAAVERPHGIGSLFIADMFSLRELSPASGHQIRSVDSTGALQPLQPTFSASADGSNLVLTSEFSNTVQVWNPESSQLVESYNLASTPFDAVRFQGTLAVSTFGTEGNVIRVDTGETLLGYPYVYYPLGLAASGNVLFVSDWLTGLVWRVDRSTGTSVPSAIASGLANPEGLALDHSGGLLVVESGAGRLSRIDLATEAVTTVAENLALGLPGYLPASAPHMTLNGVAVAPSGDIFVTGDQADVLYRVKPDTGSACGSARAH